eukprot:210689-Pelagomonas_calceolata.AAC.1
MGAVCIKGQSFDVIVSKLTHPQFAPQHRGIMVGVEELHDDEGSEEEMGSTSGECILLQEADEAAGTSSHRAENHVESSLPASQRCVP